jgi:hypothetical protein
MFSKSLGIAISFVDDNVDCAPVDAGNDACAFGAPPKSPVEGYKKLNAYYF